MDGTLALTALVLLLALLLLVQSALKRLAGARWQVNDAWTSLDRLLRRRAQLVRSLVEVEREAGRAPAATATLEPSIEAALNARTTADRIAAEEALEDRLRPVLEALGACEEHGAAQVLRADLEETERRLVGARRHYERAARDYENKRRERSLAPFAWAGGFRAAARWR